MISVMKDGVPQPTESKSVSVSNVRGVVPLAPWHAEGASSAFVIEMVGGRSVLQAPSDSDRDVWLAKLQLVRAIVLDAKTGVRLP